MQFKTVGKRLIMTSYSNGITEGENAFDEVKITLPRKHDNIDNSLLSYRFTEISEDGSKIAVQVLTQESCDDNNVILAGAVTSNFSAITGKVCFMLTGVNDDNVVAKYQSSAFEVSDDLTLAAIPDETAGEQLFNQIQLEVQKAISAAAQAKTYSETPAPAEIYPATAERLGGVLSGNDISVDGSGVVTVQSVNGKILGKSVPENAVFTDTVYALPKASADTLGGVKVDGTTITSSSDGIISAKETQNLAVQIAHPNNYLIYDDLGKPSVMVAIPKFYLDEVIDGASHTVHPAFIINGVEHDVIYISKYQNIVENDRAYSLPMKDPAVNINFDTAWNYCKNKGAGWHLMTNAEWAAIALWCKKNGTMPKGNNYYGKDTSEIDLPQKAIAASCGSNGKINRILTGSDPANWYHDGTFAGIADLNGNIWEWCSGLRLFDGEIQILPNNDAADWNNSVAANSPSWKAVMPDGSLVEPGTVGSLKWDYTEEIDNSYSNNIHITTSLENKQTTNSSYGIQSFKNISAKSGINIPENIKALAIFPADSEGYGNDGFAFKNIGERISIRGGSCSEGEVAGVFLYRLYYYRSEAYASFGFRSAYYAPSITI